MYYASSLTQHGERLIIFYFNFTEV